MRTLLTAALFLACSSRDTRPSDDRTMSHDPRRLDVTSSATVSGDEVAISPDGRLWVTRLDSDLFLFEGDAPKEIKTAGFGHGVRFSPDGSRILAGLNVFDSKTGDYARAPATPKFSFAAGLSRQATVEASGYVEGLSAACFDPTVVVVEAAWQVPRDGSIKKRTAAPARRLIAFDDQLRHVAELTADVADSVTLSALDCSKRWVVAAADRTIVWDRSNGYQRVTPPDAELPRGTAVAIAPDDRVFAVAGSTLEPQGVVSIVDPATSKVVARGESGVPTIMAVAFSPDGRRVAVGGNGKVAVLDFDGSALTLAASADVPGGGVTGIAFEPDGNALRAVGGGAHRLVLR